MNTANTSNRSRGRRFALINLIALTLLFLGAAVYWRGPLGALAGGALHLPTSTGPHAVGRVTWHLVSKSRPEVFTEYPDDRREIRADVYYPAAPDSTAPVGRYIEPEIGPDVTGMPAFITNAIKPNWREGAAPAQGAPWPVLLFSPGIDGPPVFYTSLLEELASRGWVIVALWHPYTTSRTRFPDGRIVKAAHEANGAAWEGPDEAREVAKQRISSEWAKDMIQALDEVVRRNENDPEWAGRLDLARVGAFGHSFGGQNAAAAMTLDTRIRAGMNFDGTAVYRPIIERGVTGAFAFVYDTFEPPWASLRRDNKPVETWWAEWALRNCPEAIRRNAEPCYIFQIDGISHEGFSTDLPLFKPLFPWAITEDMVGTVPAREVLDIVTDLVDAFFRQSLMGEDQDLLAEPSSHHPRLHQGIKGAPGEIGPPIDVGTAPHGAA